MTPVKPAHGVLNFQRSVRSSTTSTVSSCASQPASQVLLAGLRIQSIWYFTALASNGEPSWKVTPSRSFMTTSCGLSQLSFSASHGTVGL